MEKVARYTSLVAHTDPELVNDIVKHARRLSIERGIVLEVVYIRNNMVIFKSDKPIEKC